MSLSYVLSLLPRPLCAEIRTVLARTSLAAAKLSEVRLRLGRISSLSLYRGGALFNLPLVFVAAEADLRATLHAATEGSVFAHEEALREGYFTIGEGVRVGAAGHVFAKDGKVQSLTRIESLVFRLPLAEGETRAPALCNRFFASTGGILLFSPPGGGKTTQLRALAAAVAKTQRVAVIDTRGELFFSACNLLLDRLSGYPKAQGAEIAVRTLSPELLVLDEIGTAEAAALTALVSFGVRTVASVHAKSAEELLKSSALRTLLSSGLFTQLWDVCAACAVPL